MLKKVLYGMGLIVLTGILVVACSNASDGGSGTDASFEDIYEAIKDEMAEGADVEQAGYMEVDLMEENSDDFAAAIYEEALQLDQEQLSNGKVIAAAMNINSDEMILLEAADASHVEALQEALENRKEDEYLSWETYLPDQFEKVKNNIIKTNGNFLLYVTYEDPEAVEARFDGFFE